RKACGIEKHRDLLGVAASAAQVRVAHQIRITGSTVIEIIERVGDCERRSCQETGYTHHLPAVHQRIGQTLRTVYKSLPFPERELIDITERERMPHVEFRPAALGGGIARLLEDITARFDIRAIASVDRFTESVRSGEREIAGEPPLRFQLQPVIIGIT